MRASLVRWVFATVEVAKIAVRANAAIRVFTTNSPTVGRTRSDQEMRQRDGQAQAASNAGGATRVASVFRGDPHIEAHQFSALARPAYHGLLAHAPKPARHGERPHAVGAHVGEVHRLDWVAWRSTFRASTRCRLKVYCVHVAWGVCLEPLFPKRARSRPQASPQSPRARSGPSSPNSIGQRLRGTPETA